MASETPSSNVCPATPGVFRDLERRLSERRFRGVGMGPTLNNFIQIELNMGRGDWSVLAGLKDRLRQAYRFVRPLSVDAPQHVPPGRVLLGWLLPEARYERLVFPILEALGPQRCAVLCGKSGMAKHVSAPAEGIDVRGVLHFDRAAWRRDYLSCRREWGRQLRAAVSRHGLPSTFVPRAAYMLMIQTQRLAGCRSFLQRARPAAVLVEHDRNTLWSCLVLAARTLGIPTYTLVHGTMGEQGTSFVPLVAEKVFCWGEFDRDKFLQAGEDASRLLIGGCPRITRDLPVSAEVAREKMGLPPDRPVVLLGTATYSPSQSRCLAEAFCQAVAKVRQDVSGIVRLHPSERMETYAEVAARYPAVRFLENSAFPLDESLAAADVIVVYSSGLGSDALIKRRLTVVLDVIDAPQGHATDLIEHAGCPRGRSAGELAARIQDLLGESDERRRCEASREQYVQRYCSFYGADAARRIAQTVLREAGVSED